MDHGFWRVEFAGPRPDLTAHQLRWLQPRALSRGVRLELSTSSIRASFAVSAPDLDVAVTRARRRWETAAAALDLPNTQLSHFAIDQVSAPPDNAHSPAKNRPTPRPRSGVAQLDLPLTGPLELDESAGQADDRAPARLLALR